MKALTGLITLFLLTGTGSYGQNVLLEGHAQQFSGKSLMIREIMNPVTGDSKIIDTLAVEQDGQFSLKMKRKKDGWIFINAGIFRVTMYVRPGYGYEIELPPKAEKSESDIRNPFFKPVIAHIRVTREYLLSDPDKKAEEINHMARIFSFDTTLANANEALMNARIKFKKLDIDSLINSIEDQYADFESSWFADYRRFRYGLVRINSKEVGLSYIYDNHLKTSTPQTGNPAWYELFSEMFHEFIFYYSRTDEGRSIKYLVNHEQDLQALKDTLMNHPAVPDSKLAELIIIKECFDIYFKDYFYREALLMLLDSIIEKPEIREHADFARGVKEHLTRLKPGNHPPGLHLPDQENNYRSLNDFRGKYVYLNFCTPDNYSCLKEFPFLKVLHSVHKKHLSIVTVMVTEEHEEMKTFMSRNAYDWTALFYENDETLLSNFDVRAFPTSYLLDPEGKIVQSPAALATEGLEQQLFRIMRSRGDL